MSFLCGIAHLATYIDDMCVYSNAFEKHINIMSHVFSRTQTNGLTVKPSYSVIAFSEVKFVGSFKVMSRLTKTWLHFNFEQPKTKKQIQALLGIISYYEKYIPRFAEKVAVF